MKSVESSGAPREVPRFGERLRLLRNKRYEDWWHIVFGGPVGTLVTAAVAEVRWLTPNGLTWAGLVLRGLVCWLIVQRTARADLAAAVILQVSVVVDIMDGSLARYRKQPSAVGAFLDKVTDAIALTALTWAAGYRVALDTGESLALWAGVFIGASFLCRGYMFWVVAYHELERDAGKARTPTKVVGLMELSFAERRRYYLASTWRIIHLGEGDIYLALTIGLVAGWLRETLYLVAAGAAVWFVGLFVSRLLQMRRLDQAARG